MAFPQISDAILRNYAANRLSASSSNVVEHAVNSCDALHQRLTAIRTELLLESIKSPRTEAVVFYEKLRESRMNQEVWTVVVTPGKQGGQSRQVQAKLRRLEGEVEQEVHVELFQTEDRYTFDTEVLADRRIHAVHSYATRESRLLDDHRSGEIVPASLLRQHDAGDQAQTEEQNLALGASSSSSPRKQEPTVWESEGLECTLHADSGKLEIYEPTPDSPTFATALVEISTSDDQTIRQLVDLVFDDEWQVRKGETDGLLIPNCDDTDDLTINVRLATPRDAHLLGPSDRDRLHCAYEPIDAITPTGNAWLPTNGGANTYNITVSKKEGDSLAGKEKNHPGELERLKAGDDVAWNDFVSRVSPRLWANIFKCLGPHSKVEDFVQETFLLASDRIKTCNYNQDDWIVNALFYGHIRRSAIRDAKRRREYQAAENAPEPAAKPDIIWTRIKDAVNRLDNDIRECIEMRFFQGLSNKLIADRLGVSKRTIDKRIAAGRDILRSCLSQ